MIDFNLYWVDDDFQDKKTDLAWRLGQYVDTLSSFLRNRGINPIFTTSACGSILDDLAFSKTDLIILDVHLYNSIKNKKEPVSGFEIIDRINKLISHPPVVLFTHYLDIQTSQYRENFDSQQAKNIPKFQKSDEGVLHLAEYISELALYPPFSMVILSDLHVGYFQDKERQSIFHDILFDELRDLALRTSINYLVITGDFAWKNQGEDLTKAAKVINEIRDCLLVKQSHQFHFCPGNHDVCFNNDNPWESYYEFVMELTAGDPQLRHRFYSYHDRTERLRSFKDRISCLAVARGSQDSILFAALNSCNIENNDTIVKPEVGEEQWNGLRKLLENEPINQLRIAILHHPIFAAPGGDFPDERPLFDQAEAVHRLSNLNFQLLIHGHSHFSAVYEHRVTILNEPSCHSASKLTVIACPTCGAEPSSSTPIRQYMIISIGQYDRATNSRSLRVRTRIYNQSNKTWSEGGAPFDSKIFIEDSRS